MKKAISIIALLMVISFLSAGCGETVNGAIKDTKRMGKGVKTIFVRE